MITHERLREVLHYDPLTGDFTWIQQLSLVAKIGRIAGCIDQTTNARLIKIDYKSYIGHRLAWFYMTGKWPTDEIDHIDGCRSNNVWANLREATGFQNRRNVGLTVRSKSGLKGAYWDKRDKRWKSAIRHDGGRKSLGHFDTPEAAHAAYCEAAKKYHGEFARLK